MSAWFIILAASAPSLSPASDIPPDVEIMVKHIADHAPDGTLVIAFRLLNESFETRKISLPRQIPAQLEQGGQRWPVSLVRHMEGPDGLLLASGTFARARYRLLSGHVWSAGEARLDVAALKLSNVTLDLPSAGDETAISSQDEKRANASLDDPVPPPTNRVEGNAFVSNFSAYEPIYAVYGPGTNSEARIQLSFKYQLFGTRRSEGLPRSWRDGLHFAYTQRMFWDLGAHSSPFRNIDFQPEIFYLTPPVTTSDGTSLSAQMGLRHESNGRAGTASRSVNSIYLAPMAAIPLGGGYRLSVAPRLSFNVGDRSDNPDIRRYRGNAGLWMEVGQDDGVRLSAMTRYNFASGKGALNTDISFPLARLLGDGPDFYLFGQSFVGYGENLLDYDRRMTRFRIGLALVR